MKVVVTGATGNVGTALLRRLTDADIVGVARRVPESRPPYDRAEWTPVDIGEPGAEELLAEVMQGADAVVHLAWRIQPSHDQNALFRTNVTGSDQVFTAAVRAGVPHLVHMSSVGVYAKGDKSRRVAENWPNTGISSSTYSRHKAAVEHLLDAVERDNPELVVSRPRPGLILQADSAAEIKRYFFGPLVPGPLFRLAQAKKVPVLPLPRRTVLQFVHADDVADALAKLLATRAPGPFNIVAEPEITPAALAKLVGARHVPVPAAALRALVAATWRLRLQPTAEGWVDLALGVPLLDAGRARGELGWTPRHGAHEVVSELLAGLAHREDVPGSPALRA